ncbi:hypothetical protein CLOACE_02340 [Clostridium acetireducens DSM 10703]|uniref:Apea-like HEPN domain-containing protein n=1 Tax=Clostridium acetireducens DSM 10703 TaxID=1121290 RepID=A0A1E8F201_9CLOT|nr:hypothetical protein [Clostridium acetireducens]OFI07630.1 hypothetical protein CLOACE_02340 [Clostridium acetireducens DSM 10703]
MNIQEKNFLAKKYFIFAFKKYISNENKILSKRFQPSIRELLLDYINIYEDIIHNVENKLLIKAKKDLIVAIIFYLNESVFYKKNIYKEEINFLIKDLEKVQSGTLNQFNEIKIYNKCKSIVKKIDNDNIYKYLVEVIKNIYSYKEVDEVIEAIISELLYDGFSLKYLQKWYNYYISKELTRIKGKNIDEIIDLFCSLFKEDSNFKYYLTIKSKTSLPEKIYLNCNLIMVKESFSALRLINDKDNKETKKYLQYGQEVNAYSIQIKAKDYYKGLEIIIDSIVSYFQMINYLSDDSEIILNDKIVVKVSEGVYEKLRKEMYDENILFHESERREKGDIKDFISYRDKVYIKKIGVDEIPNIQRTINIIKGQKQQSKENRLINLWSVLEYMLTFHGGDSIISKAKDIVPKVCCLYVLKDKINLFWNSLNQYKASNYKIISEVIENCRIDNDEYRYDLEKFIRFICKKGEEIVEEFAFNDVLKRNISEIGTLLFNEKIRNKLIKSVSIEVEMDLIRIYRYRNILIHSRNRDIRNINYKTLRLYQYNNNILGVIIHYKKNNPYLTIEEILNSIEYTYEKYINNIGKKLKDNDLVNICRPKYLFIE